jgi:hypothetical protein
MPVDNAPGGGTCTNAGTDDLSVDGLLDDWSGKPYVKRVGSADGALALRCIWDATALGIALDITDDRIVRVPTKGDDDRVVVELAASNAGATGRKLTASISPGNAIAKPRVSASPKIQLADSLQPRGFSVEVLVPAAAIPELSSATAELALRVTFHDSDQATGGDATDIVIDVPIELGERSDLFSDFLRRARLERGDIKLDTFADLDPGRPGKERIVAGGTIIGVITDQYGFVSLPAASAADVRKIELLPLGKREHQVISAVIRQSGNGGSRDILALWTVWSGQLEPLRQIEIRKEVGANVLECSYKIVKGKKGPELHVEPKPAIGFTAETWNEIPAPDSDPILVPWDTTKSGVVYELTGAELANRDLPPPKTKPKKK